jgi:nitronate monooxygenase
VHRSNERLEADLAACVEFEVPVVVTSLGARQDVNDALHSYGALVLHDVTHGRFARSAVEKGADGLVAVAAGAGGHAGSHSPFALVQEIRRWFSGPLLLSGAISVGRSILAAQAAGADLAYIGSPFIATVEASAPRTYKQMIVDSAASDIVYSSLFSGIGANYLRESIEAVGLDPSKPGWDLGGRPEDVKPWSQVWGAGQGVGAVEGIVPVAERVERWIDEYRAACADLDRASASFRGGAIR